MSNSNVLRTITDRFDLFRDGRKVGANKRNYILESVRSMIANSQERIHLGEAYGYYGHGGRKMAGTLTPAEQQIVRGADGSQIVMMNIPACRTKSITVDKNGVVEHTQEVLSTDTGKLVDSLIESGAGGWSWAVSGRDTASESVTRDYFGMDYVLQPNFLSLNHPAMLLESAESRDSMILESLQNHANVDPVLAKNALNYLKNSASDFERLVALEQENMYLESVINEKMALCSELSDEINKKSAFGEMILESLERLPIYISNEQRNALKNLASTGDQEIVTAMFESLMNDKFHTLPIGDTNNSSIFIPSSSLNNNDDGRQVISFNPRERSRFGK